MDEPTCAGCRELLKRVAELEAKLRELEARLGQNASNSSIPPSANPPQAPPPLVKKPTGRKPGGQPGHRAHLRARLPAERLTEPTMHYLPKVCEACQHELPAAMHQVVLMRFDKSRCYLMNDIAGFHRQERAIGLDYPSRSCPGTNSMTK